MRGKTYKAGNLEMYADGGSIVVINNSKNISRRVSVPDWRDRLEAVAIYGLGRAGSEYSAERDMYKEATEFAQAMQGALKDAEEQGDVTLQCVRTHLLDELTMNPKYTMKPVGVH